MLRFALLATLLFSIVFTQGAQAFVYERDQDGVRYFTQMPKNPLVPRWGESKINLELFETEANETLDQAALSEKRLIPWINQIKAKIVEAKNNNQIVTKITLWNRWATSIDSENDHVKRITLLYQKLFNSIRSYHSALENESLIVPLSVEYFMADPEFALFFKSIWIGSGWDIRLFGSSGEGVTTQSPESFAQMLCLFNTTTLWLKQHPQSAVNLRSESSWLRSLSEEKLSHIKRLIFIHDDSWKLKADASFADYISIDPQIMGIRPMPLASILIHELNVNSMNFLFQDTHLSIDAIEENRQANHTETFEYMGRQPLIALVYLSMIFQ